MVGVVDLKGEWAAAIGKAFVAFGAIEYATVICIREIPRDRIQKTLKALKLAQRIDLILELLEAHPGVQSDRLSTDLRKAKDLSITRNLVAHNPLVLSVYESAGGGLHIREIISSLHKDVEVTLPQLRAFAEESEALSTALFSSVLTFIRDIQRGPGA